MKPGIFLIVRRSLRQHALSTAVTTASVALAAGLLMSVFSLKDQARRAFAGGPVGFDAVLGARSSKLQLVLNAVFHLDVSPGNIPWSLYRTIKSDPRVSLAVPIAVGDNYLGWRIVGTTDEMFSKFEYEKGVRYRIEEGKLFDPAKREAVVGALAARRTGLKVGDVFNPFHGVVYDENMRHDETFTVSGVMAPTNTPSDRVIWIPVEGMYRMKGHVLRGGGKEYTAKEGEAIPDDYKEVSAVLLKLRGPQAGFSLDMMINRQGKVATLAWPVGGVMAEFLDRMGWVRDVLGLVAVMTAFLSAAALLSGLHNAMDARRREFAILRALGARRRTVFGAVVAEAAVVAGIGSLAGYAVYGVIFGAAAWLVRARTGVVLDLFSFNPALLWTPPALTALGMSAGVLPAWKAYATDVAENLSPQT